MVNGNAKNIVKQVLSSGDTVGLLAVKDVGGTIRYIADYSAYPADVEGTFTLTAANAGISVGSGSTTPTENDYQLASTITSGLTGTVAISQDVDANGNTSITYSVTLTNTSGSSIDISEIGYKQTIAASDSLKGTTATDRVFLLDRSVFETITLAAGGQAVIDYKIKAVVTNGGGVEGTKTITHNGTYLAEDDDLDGYSSVTVNVPSATLVSKSITENGTYDPQDDNADGYSSVTVNVSGGGSSIIFYVDNVLISTHEGRHLTVPLDRQLSVGTVLVLSIKDGNNTSHTLFTYTGGSMRVTLPGSYNYRVDVTETTIGMNYYTGSYRDIYAKLSEPDSSQYYT